MKIWQKNCYPKTRKKKIFICVCIIIVTLVVVYTAWQAIKVYNKEKDSYWQIAKEIYKVEQALKKEDEDWELQSLSSVTPYCYSYQDGREIMYYHCTTSYLTDEPLELDGLNTVALGQIVDVEALENSRECMVNDTQAIIGELEGRIYLCWTLTPKDSCIIEYIPEEFSKEDIFRMAESVYAPD